MGWTSNWPRRLLGRAINWPRRLVKRIKGLHLYEGGEVSEELGRKLTRVHVGRQVAEISDYAFFACEKLAEVQLPEGLHVIGEEAFRSCTALQCMTLPSTVTELGTSAFQHCSNLVEVRLNEGLKTIGDGAFAGCKSLRSVDIPSTIIELGEFLFDDCDNLIEIHLNEGLQIVGQIAFAKCKALQSVTIPSTVKTLSKGAFSGCSKLAEVKFNKGLQVVGGGAFKCCTALLSMTLPSTVTELGIGAFYSCIKLSEVKLNEGLRIIGKGAFQYCIGLQSVTIPSTVTKLDKWETFHGCINLSEVIFLGGERLLDREFIDRGILSEEGLLNRGALDELLFDDSRNFAFHGCPLTTVKISVAGVVSERMARLPQECRVSVEERIYSLPRLEQIHDGNIFACFSVVHQAGEIFQDEDTYEVQDINHETARSLCQVLQLIAFHELKESSIMIELAMWKSRINEHRARADCRVPIPDPAKSLIMEYCFAGFLEPAIEGA